MDDKNLVNENQNLAAFTPGPWEVGGTWRNSIDDRSKGETTVIYAECIPLARTIWILNSGEYARSQEQATANARLIAAAPKLYEALRGVLGFLNVTPLNLNIGDSITLSMLEEFGQNALALANGQDTNTPKAGQPSPTQ